jgi:hypothetical protein
MLHRLFHSSAYPAAAATNSGGTFGAREHFELDSLVFTGFFFSFVHLFVLTLIRFRCRCDSHWHDCARHERRLQVANAIHKTSPVVSSSFRLRFCSVLYSARSAGSGASFGNATGTYSFEQGCDLRFTTYFVFLYCYLFYFACRFRVVARRHSNADDCSTPQPKHCTI